MADGAGAFFQSPWTALGMGLLAGNRGQGSQGAFSNAMRSGLSGLQQSNQFNMFNQQSQLNNQLLMQQIMRDRQEAERQRQMQHMAPQLLAGMSSAQPETRAQAQAAVAGMQPSLLPQMLMNQQRMAMKPLPETWRPLSAEERSEYGLKKDQPAQISTSGKISTPGTPLVNMAAAPTGMARQPDPASPTGTRLVPEPGGREDVKRREGVNTLQQIYDDISELEDLVQTHGTEAYGPVARRMKVLRAGIIGNIPAVRQTGVLQEGELKRLEQELPRGEALVSPGFMALPGISRFREEVGRKLEDKRTVYGLEAEADSLPVVRSDDDAAYDAMPSGTRFQDENGRRYVKP